MTIPTPAEIREWSKVNFEELDYGEDEQLQLLIDRAVGWVERVSGQELDTIDEPLETLAGEAIQRWVEHTAFRTQEDVIETAADFDLISSFSVTGYSENRRNAKDAKKAQMIHPWPLLHDLIWQLATEDAQDEWLETWGARAPAFEVTEVDWDWANQDPRYLSPGSYPHSLD